MEKIETVDDFKAFVENVESQKGYRHPLAFGIGIATLDSDENLLDTFFPVPNFKSNYGTAAVFAHVLGHLNGTSSYEVSFDNLDEILQYFTPFENDGKQHDNIEAIKSLRSALHELGGIGKCVVVSFITQDALEPGPQDVPDAYLRLHLLSHRLVKPHGINLDGLFGILPNVAWTSEGPVSLEDLPARRIKALSEGRQLVVNSMDKFPRMVDYVVPTGVRIGDASRVRLGAYLGDGTTVMPEGFINFNAGCEGPNMIEGRISAGVFVGAGSDLGGGCSIMGTLSGGGSEVISIGEGCLIGANGGTGISLGDGCTIEAGLYVTAGAKVEFGGGVAKAKRLSGQDNLLFRRSSLTGAVEVIQKANTVELNEALHAN